MSRRLFIHVGPAKTGTSAVQHALREHDNSVVIYPKVGLWADGSHHNLVLNFFKDYARPEMMKCDVDVLLQEIGELAAFSDRAVVISSEILAGRKNIETFIRSLMRVTNCAAEDVEILFVCRDHLERAASLYNQRVKDSVTRETRDPDVFLAAIAENLRYAPFIRRLCRSGFRVTLLNYHPCADFVARFFRHLGFADACIPNAEQRNVSLSVKGLIATLAGNRATRTAQARGRILDGLKARYGVFGASQFIFGSRAATSADEIFAADREFLRARHGLTLPVPDFAARENAFSLSFAEFEEIVSAAQQFNEEDNEIAHMARDYLRAD